MSVPPVATPEAETPSAVPAAEGSPAVDEAEEVTPAETPAGKVDAPTEGETTEAPAEGEAPAEEAKPDITEEAIKVAAVRYANKTMAAARRAEQRVESVKAQNEQLTSSLKLHTDFIAELRTSPLTAIRKLGFQSVRDFLDAGINAGGEPAAPDPVDAVKQLQKEIREEREKAAREAQVAKIDAVIEARIATDKAKYARVNTKLGTNELWKGITHYHQTHGSCPPEAVVQIATNIEAGLRAEFGDPQISAPSSSANKTTPAAAPAAPAARNGGKTLTNRSSSSAPSTKEYSLDPDERRAQIDAEMRAEGLL